MPTLKKTIKLKLDLKLTDELREVLDKYTRAVNFFLKRCFFLRHRNRMLGKRKRFAGTCSACKEDREIVSNGSLGQLCVDCWKRELSYTAMRKRFVPTKKRRVPAADNVYLVAPGLSASLVDVAWSHARAILKTWFRLDRRRRGQLRDVKNKLKLWREVLEDKEVVVGGERVKARVVVPPKRGQRSPRFRHINHPEGFKGRTLAGIKSIVERLEKRLRTLSREPKPPSFKGGVMWLKNTSVKFLDEGRVELKLNGHRVVVGFHAAEVKREKSREYLLKHVRLILDMQERGIRAYPQLEFQGNDCFLSFPVRLEVQIPEPDESYGAIGIDRGVNSLIAFAAINRPCGKPHHLWLASGEKLSSLRAERKAKIRRLQEKARSYRDQGRRFRLNRRLRSMKGEGELSKHILHEISRRVVERARELYPDGKVVIVMEELKGLQPVRGKRHERALNFRLSGFAYKKLQSLIEYKAMEARIPVAYVQPAGTSTKCSKCGHDDPANRPKGRGYFKCSRCGLTLNADLNAAVNIANAFYETVKRGAEK